MLFAGANAVLQSHRGWDSGALIAARLLRRQLRAPLFAASISRLLIDLNRSLHHPRVFSQYSRVLAPQARQKVIDRYYVPHRSAIENAVAAAPSAVLHFCVHSFTPVLDGVVRQTDVALLYDPKRPRERAFCRRFAAAWRQHGGDWRLRFNYPYKGSADGLTTALRRRFADRRYAGIELEINQKHVNGHAARWLALQRALAACLRASL